jgi:hypothetical protein
MKTITINGNRKISEIKKEFNEVFPFLKLEFFNTRHPAFHGSARNATLNENLSIKQISKIKKDGAIILREEMKVSELENLFQELFGMPAQVFRKSGRSWIETTVTDDWTLKRQNDEGRELSLLN